MNRPALAVVAALAALTVATGCTSYQSTYHRSHVTAGELVWSYDNAFQVTQDGKIVAAQRDWDGLSGVVACVPRARDTAESAASRDRTGKIVSWTGVAILTVGAVAGTALVFRDTSNTDSVLAGLGAIGGGLVIGLPTFIGGFYTRARADTTAIDAVNIYNDERGSCRRTP
jgi:hypothetical protein